MLKFRRMHGFSKRLLWAALLLLLLAAYIVYYCFSRRNLPWYYKAVATCSHTDDVVEDLAMLSKYADLILNKCDVLHFLCYGSLWGAIRIQQTLPWDTNVDFCVYFDFPEKSGVIPLNMKVLSDQLNVSIAYDADHGIYSLHYRKAAANLVVFQLTDDYIYLRRVGKLFKDLPDSARDAFPSNLAAPPLPTMKFHGIEMPVPHNGIMIQKIFYPNDFWKEVKPPNCYV